MADKKWLKGDTHLHTTCSDGVLTFEELVAACKKRGLDWMIVTDHNHYTADKAFYHEGMLVIPGEEYTGGEGHVNIWGSGLPPLPEGRPERYEQYVEVCKKAKEVGATVSVNHPFCKKCGWHMELEDFDMDCVEVWNAPMHIDNMTNLEWWHSQLLKGRRIAAVGGSDYHRDYVVTHLIACPTTYVYVSENTEEAVLEALRKGNSFVTNSPRTTQLYLSCGSAVMGDEVAWRDGITATLKALKLKKNHTVRVWNNNELIYEFKAKRKCTHTAEFEVPHKGFIRAEVLYSYGRAGKALYGKVVSKIMPLDAGLEIPAFAHCFTNPVYFI